MSLYKLRYIMTILAYVQGEYSRGVIPFRRSFLLRKVLRIEYEMM